MVSDGKTYRIVLTANSVAPRKAREWVFGMLRAWGLAPKTELAGVIALLLTELVTNAAKADWPEDLKRRVVVLKIQQVSADPLVVRVDVGDRSPKMPMLEDRRMPRLPAVESRRAFEAAPQGGWGLAMFEDGGLLPATPPVHFVLRATPRSQGGGKFISFTGPVPIEE
jgi:hypothetical protein